METFVKKLILIFIMLLVVACGSVKKAFGPDKKDGSDAFLIEKKSPLTMPPSYGELPTPLEKKKNEEDKADIQKIITGSKSKKKINKTSSVERLILKEIKKN
jgi:hypothetical protein